MRIGDKFICICTNNTGNYKVGSIYTVSRETGNALWSQEIRGYCIHKNKIIKLSNIIDKIDIVRFRLTGDIKWLKKYQKNS